MFSSYFSLPLIKNANFTIAPSFYTTRKFFNFSTNLSNRLCFLSPRTFHLFLIILIPNYPHFLFSRPLEMILKLLSAQYRLTPIPSDPDQAISSFFARHTHLMANHSHLILEMPLLLSSLISTTPLRSLGSVLNRYVRE